jgi:hypothetical protein
MPYSYFYDNIINLPPSVGSRTHALIFPGAVCPQEASFGRVHGTSPATGKIQFKGTVLVPIAQPMTIQIGQSVFYGLALKGEIQNSIDGGNNVTFNLVDLRDRLHDQNHAAQYNMMDETGTWWHILPINWQLQIATFIHDLEEVEDYSTSQTVPNYNLNLLAACPPAFSLRTLMEWFAILYNFTFSWTESAGEKMDVHYPENLDFNIPTKVIDCIDAMLTRSNLQFTAWGDLHLHITDKGIPDNPFEEELLAGTIDLCSLIGYMNASIGSELNTKGRRIAVVGGRNQYEFWYPCGPDWNGNFDYFMVNPFSPHLAALLTKHQLFADKNLLEDLPEKYHDCRKYQGRSRNKMTIQDYIEKICYKAYRVIFNIPLRQVYEDRGNAEGIILQAEPECEHFQQLDASGGFVDIDPANFNFPVIDNYKIDSLYPISQKLVSDTNHQFLCKGTSREQYVKGERDDKAFFLDGCFAYLTEGVALEVDEYILAPPVDPSLVGQFNEERRQALRKEKTKCPDRRGPESDACLKYYRATLYFEKQRFWGQNPCGFENPLGPGGENDNTPGHAPSDPEIYNWLPDHIYCLLSIDREIYLYFAGETELTPRVRETIINHHELKRFFSEFREVPMLARNFIEEDYISIVYADELANEIALRKLNHEMITTAGHITFRTNAGFMPSGIIDSISITFNARTGTQETINFTNILNDDRVPNFLPAQVTRGIKSEAELRKDLFTKKQNEVRRKISNTIQQGQFKEGKKDDWGFIKVGQRFGGMDNAAAVKIFSSQLSSDSIPPGELMLVEDAAYFS